MVLHVAGCSGCLGGSLPWGLFCLATVPGLGLRDGSVRRDSWLYCAMLFCLEDGEAQEALLQRPAGERHRRRGRSGAPPPDPKFRGEVQSERENRLHLPCSEETPRQTTDVSSALIIRLWLVIHCR